MHPARTAIVGLLLVGLAHANSEPKEATYLNSRLYAQGDIPDLLSDSPYWWMNKGSPFKRSYSADPANNGYSNGIGAEQQFAASAGNPFLSGKPFAASSGYETAAATNGGAAYAAPGYLPPDQTTRTISCTQQGQVCVSKYLCRNGFVDNSLTEGSKLVSG